MKIRFNYPYKSDNELEYIKNAMNKGRLAGDGEYTLKCSELLEKYLSVSKVLLTHSCTAALEMAAILLEIQPGDEIIMPSYTFVSTANAFVLRGGVPVFVDVRPDTLNIDEAKIEAVITNKTKGICVVHYAGVACEMDIIMKLAKKHNLAVVEDAAQAIGAEYKGRKLGAIGDLATFSFHETKNIQSGEGGALVINNSIYAQRAEIIREKGTDRTRFFRGEVEKYTWVDIGSSYLPSELVSAFLFAQLEQIDTINAMRKATWNEYKKNLSSLELDKLITIQDIPESHTHNAHMFYILLNNHDMQEKLLQHLKLKGVSAVFHYIPLHMSKAGSVYSKVPAPLNVTEDIYNRIIRLPMYPNLDKVQIKYITNEINIFMKNEKLC